MTLLGHASSNLLRENGRISYKEHAYRVCFWYNWLHLVVDAIVSRRALHGVRRWRHKNQLKEITVAPFEPPHPKRTLQALDVVLSDLRTFREADPENDTLRDAENTAIALQKLLSSYSDSYVSKST